MSCRSVFAAIAFATIAHQAAAVSSSIVISQVHGAGGSAGALYNADYVELYNKSNSAVDITGWSIQYVGATGSVWFPTNLPSVSIPAGKFYLVQMSSAGATGSALPGVDHSAAIGLGNTDGKVIVANNTTVFSGPNPFADANAGAIIDFVGYGTATTWEGAGATAAINTSLAIFRSQETDDNRQDFCRLTPMPRNSATVLPLINSTLTADTTLNVGTGGDYTSLAAAALDFSTAPNGINFNLTLLITSNLTETGTTAFGATMAPGKVFSIKPAPSTIAKITFPGVTSNTANLFGHLHIGNHGNLSNNLGDQGRMPNTIIDGQNTGDAQLTLENNSTANGNQGSSVLMVSNNQDGTIIRNLIINNLSTSNLTSVAGQADCISLVSNTMSAVTLDPDNVEVTSNTLTANTAAGGIGIRQHRGTAGAANGGQTNVDIHHNWISASLYGIQMDRTNGGCKARSNRVRVDQPFVGTYSKGIVHSNVGGASNWGTVEISGNTLDQLKTANTAASNFGLAAIALEANGAAPGGTLSVYNNSISGFNYTAVVGVTEMNYRGIFVLSSAVNPNYNIYHNSVYMPALPNVGMSVPTASRVSGITIDGTAVGTNGSNVKNNIVYFGENGGEAAHIVPLTGVTVDYNDFYATGSASIGTAGTNNVNFDPTVAYVGRTGSWDVFSSPNNLHWSNAPGFIYGAPSVGITTDIDGDSRGVAQSNVFIGSDELVTGLPVSLSEFSVD